MVLFLVLQHDALLMQLITFVGVIALLSQLPVAVSWSYGAGSCSFYSGSGYNGGLYWGIHWSLPGTKTVLSDGNFSVSIDSKPLATNASATIAIGQDHIIKFSAGGNTLMRGLLARIDTSRQADTSHALLPLPGDTLLQNASYVCGAIGSVTHTDPNPKRSVSAKLRWDTLEILTLTVGVVTVCDGFQSDYYVSTYIIRAAPGTPSKPPTRKPTKPPTRKPTKPPTRLPTKPPTLLPTKPPTRKPTKPPTRKPTKPPTRKPVKPPTQKPNQKARNNLQSATTTQLQHSNLLKLDDDDDDSA